MAGPRPVPVWRTFDARVAALAIVTIVLHLMLRGAGAARLVRDAPLVAAILVGGLPLVLVLGRQLLAAEFGSDLLAAVSIVTATLLGEYLIAVVVILMLSGGQTLERYATARASSALDALARRNPTTAHRQLDDAIVDVPIEQIAVGDVLVVLPHETCPVDGTVRTGASTMDESYLSGEPFLLRKTVGSSVISGAINGDSALTIVAERRALDSRYARIMAIVAEAERRRPPMRRMADRLGAWYTPLAVTVGIAGAVMSGDPRRFLAVVVIATPCPLLLAIPVALIGAISLGARRTILIKDAAVLETIGSCRTVIFDKTGTLTLGRPVLDEVICTADLDRTAVLSYAASLEQYSKHPLASAVLQAADAAQVRRGQVSEASELPGQGLSGVVDGHAVRLTSRRLAPAQPLPPEAGGLECLVIVDGRTSALLRFRDVPRRESELVVGHLGPKHGINRMLVVSGDRESEVRYLAEKVRISEVRFGQTPEQKVAIVQEERRRQPTLFIGDGLNDAPAMLAATVSVAVGQHQEVAAESAGAVILDGSLSRVDELLHIARRTRRIALQSAIGGMCVSIVGMGLAAVGWLPPLSGAIAQEVIDVAAVLNALRAAFPPPELTDF